MLISPAVRAELNHIRDFILKADGMDGYELMNILSAIRGPDTTDPDSKVKLATTAVIRYEAFGPEVFAHKFIVMGAEKDSPSKAAIRASRPENTSSHFWWHAMHAFYALGLKWSESDPKEEK